MIDELVSRLPDADMQAAPKALLRAARRAREVARRTGTAIVIERDGRLIEQEVGAGTVQDDGTPLNSGTE